MSDSSIDVQNVFSYEMNIVSTFQREFRYFEDYFIIYG